MLEKLQIGIVGAGSAGLAAAIFLAEEGASVTLFDQTDEVKPVGAGFLLQPTGMAVLKRLGISEEVLGDTQRVDRLYCRNGAGKVLLNLHYEEAGGSSFYGAGTHRASFLDCLIRRALALGVEMKWGVKVSKMDQPQKERRVLRSEDGDEWGDFDLVLVCDGARSRLRGQCGIPLRVDSYPWGALWFIGHRTADFDENTLWQCVDSTHHLGGFLPTGTKDDLLSFFWSIRMSDYDCLKKRGLAAWKEEVLDFIPEGESFLEQIEAFEDLKAATYYDVRMKRWHGDRVVVMGDAGHALSPQLGQGVNLALIDAAVLIDCLKKFPLSEALGAFTRERKKHLYFYQFATRWTTPFFQSDYAPLAYLRDWGFPLAMKIPWTRQQMTKTMAGMKTGVFGEL